MTDPSLTRRGLMTGAAALAAGATVAPGAARAAAPQLGQSVPAHYRVKLGAFEVTTILDGAVEVPGPHPIFGENVSAEEVAELARQNFLPAERMIIPFTVTIVNTGDAVLVFDTGNGGTTGRRPAAGLLRARMQSAGIAPEDVDHVVLTHFHPDHIGGMIEDGQAAFPNASYVIPAREYDFWSSEDRLFEASTADNGQLVQDNVVPFADQARMIAPGEAVVSGVESVKAWGHTPGHTAYHVESEGKRLMLIADTSNHYVASVMRPEWHVRFDMDKEAAVATRKEVLGMIAADRIPFVGYHMPFPSLGYLEEQGPGFRFVPVSYQLQL